MWSATTESRSGLRVTAPIGDQSRVVPDQRRWVALTGLEVQLVSSSQDGLICAAMGADQG